MYRSSYKAMNEARANATTEDDEANLIRDARKAAAMPMVGNYADKDTNDDRSWKRHRKTQYRP